jgi:acyl dehydratase
VGGYGPAVGDGVIEAGFEPRPSAWLEIDQARIDAFAGATEDRQSIHVDPEAAAAGPFGTTVAHGFLTLSLLVHFWNDVAPPHDGVTINYGLNKVRFSAPVPVGSRIRGTFRVQSVEQLAGAAQATIAATVEREGGDRPVCVAELLLRFVEPS